MIPSTISLLKVETLPVTYEENIRMCPITYALFRRSDVLVRASLLKEIKRQGWSSFSLCLPNTSRFSLEEALVCPFEITEHFPYGRHFPFRKPTRAEPTWPMFYLRESRNFLGTIDREPGYDKPDPTHLVPANKNLWISYLIPVVLKDCTLVLDRLAEELFTIPFSSQVPIYSLSVPNRNRFVKTYKRWFLEKSNYLVYYT